ncbi:MAG: hypothetical protein VYC56_01545 [Actinomycetota bacterium]|jgi:hypothetical protein|nr:hypothetical protein [Actinomycetota bacterium]MEC9394567.1 hypothetical protein [Actinomycetota bacterium]MED6328637.1 hypothetical protein [Actinomycetota bacterium]MEE2957557.1 hypothetical protein [Actinomycetota bacterium]
MSIPVSLADVPDRLVEYGISPFLVTTSADGAAKVVHVSVLWDQEASAFHCAPGRGTLQNLAGHGGGADGGSATLVFPGPDAGTHSWLVDATGTVTQDADGWVVLSYDSGVLHRPAPDTPGLDASC